MEQPTQQPTTVYFRIGSGTKIHPGRLYGTATRGHIMPTCRCPGTSNGAAMARAMIVRSATQATCQS